MDPQDVAVVVGLALRVTALLLLALGATWLLRRRAASTRHRVWSLAVVGSLALPALMVALPPLPLPAPSWMAGDDGLLACVNLVPKLGQFPAPTGGAVDVNIPFVFAPG